MTCYLPYLLYPVFMDYVILGPIPFYSVLSIFFNFGILDYAFNNAGYESTGRSSLGYPLFMTASCLLHQLRSISPEHVTIPSSQRMPFP